MIGIFVAIASFHQLAYSHFGVPSHIQTALPALCFTFSTVVRDAHTYMARQSTRCVEGPDDSYSKLQKVSQATN